MNDTESEKPDQSYHHFEGRASLDHEPPFVSEMDCKYVHLSPESLKGWASQNNISLDPEASENGVVLLGFSTQEHIDILAQALDIPDRQSNPKSREFIQQFKVINAGHVINIDDRVEVMGSSPSLQSETQSPNSLSLVKDKDKKAALELNTLTANALNTIYQGKYTFVPFQSKS